MSIINERAKTHGDYAIQSAMAQDLKRRIRQEGSRLSPQQLEALEMICVKIARIVCGNPNEMDHWLDISGYAELIHKKRAAMGDNLTGDFYESTDDCTGGFGDSFAIHTK